MAKNAKNNLLEHSEAKVLLLKKYLSTYLNIISRSKINQVFLFDLFCGEGIYEDEGKGSPIIILECIKRHYFSYQNNCVDMKILFNDSGYSDLEPNTLKIDRVKRLADKIFKPENVEVHFRDFDYDLLIKQVINRTKRLKTNERALIFIDPWGYKEIKPIDIKNLLSNEKTEVILFIPIYFMSRFVEKSRDKDFRGGEAIRNFISQLFGDIENLGKIRSQKDFIYKIQEQFKQYLELKYVDTFKIERSNNNWFCLFFFTNNKVGFEKMIQTKWSIDKKQGSEYKKGDEIVLSLFDEINVAEYDKKVISLIKKESGVTNQELTDFGYENNFLPTHTKQILDSISENLTLKSLDNKEVRSFYIGNPKRKILIKYKT